MAQQVINIGASADDGTGDPLRESQRKANLNFTELYGLVSGAVVAPGLKRLYLKGWQIIDGVVVPNPGDGIEPGDQAIWATPPTVEDPRSFIRIGTYQYGADDDQLDENYEINAEFGVTAVTN